jgi:hypothetical protein
MQHTDWQAILDWIKAIKWQTVTAVLAFVFSIYTFRKTHKLSEKQVELVEDQKRLNRMLVEKEEVEARNTKKANVSARLVKVMNNNWRVKIFNMGKAEARHVRIEFDTDSDNGILAKSDVESKFPMDRLEPQQGVDLIASLHLNSPSKIPINLIWDDDTGNDHSKTVDLTH